MKVLHVIPSVAPVRGGPSQAIFEMVAALRDRGIEAEIATTNDNGVDLLDVPLCQKTQYRQVPVYFFPRFSPAISAVREFAFSSDLTRWLWDNMANYELVHIHAVFSYPSTIAMAIARYKGIPYIIRPLGQLCEWSLQQSPWRKQLYLSLIERKNLNHSRAIHFTSDQEQQESLCLGLKSRNLVVPHGLSLPDLIPDAHLRLRKRLNLPDDHTLVLYMSRLHPKKGLDYLIPALGQIQQRPFTLILAGSGSADYEAELRQLIDSSGIAQQVYWAGFVSGEEKHLLLQGSDLFALTSYSENFGVAVLEAMAAGLPVLVTPGVALASVIQQHGLGEVSALDIPAIAQALEKLFSQSQQGLMPHQYIRGFVQKNYSWSSISEQLVQAYRQIIQGSTHATSQACLD
jgi:glycosyltransferase involved in cell wall biosynthesis